MDDVIAGNWWRREGVSGAGLKSDDYTTRIVRKAPKAPRLSSALTVEAWVALAAYPWNWAPVAAQAREPREGFSEIQETLPLAQVGQGPDDIFEHDLLKLANMKGETHTYSWPGPEVKGPVSPEGANTGGREPAVESRSLSHL